jgi:large subunit ribosomal protein L7/L12
MMSTMTDEELIESILNLPAEKLLKVRAAIADKLGLEAHPITLEGYPIVGVAYGAPFGDEVQTKFDVLLESFPPDSKVCLIKLIRTIYPKLTLSETSSMIASVPAVIESGISKFEAEDMKKKLEEIGGKVSIK